MNSVPKKNDRRRYLKGFLASVFFMSPLAFMGRQIKVLARGKWFVRPPGALAEKDFMKQCIGCFKCATACPNDCIEMAGETYGAENIHTPVISPRSRACILCMRCTEVCPTGALVETSPDKEVYVKTVKMGLAKVDENLCYSFYGRTCGVCYRACPLSGKAMTIGQYEQPTVHAEHCVGCGLCEQACIHMPQAIRIFPLETEEG